MGGADAIVIGTGGIGSAALYHLAKRGAKVLGLDRFPGGHDRGSSHGQTRIIRRAYFEHPDYVPLLQRAFALWAELEARCGQRLLDPVGLLQIGPPDGVVITGVLASARRHALLVETLEPRDVARRFPGFMMPAGHVAVYEKGAGYLLVEDCVLAHLREATRMGAELRIGQEVTGWRVEGDDVVVTTAAETFRAARLVVAAGAWAGRLLGDLGLPLRLLRKHQHWFACDDPRYRREEGCPTFFYELPEGFFYGFPRIDGRGVKAAEHSGGVEIDDPLTADRSVDRRDRARVRSFLQKHLPGVSATAKRHEVCWYTMSPDGHFIVDRHPEHERISFVAGLSGHGFKFAPVLGEAMAQLALDGATPLPIEFLRLERLGGRRSGSW